MKLQLLAVLCLVYWTNLCLAGQKTTISAVFSAKLKPYEQALAGLKGHLEGQNAAFSISEYYLPEENPETLYSKITQEKPTLILVLGPQALKLIEQKVKDIPVVFCMVLNPSVPRGQNVTGVSMEISPLLKLKKIKELFPQTRKIGLVYSQGSASELEKIVEASDRMGIQVIKKYLESEKDLPEAIKDISWKIDFFLMIPDPGIYFQKSIEHLFLASLAEKFPVIGLSSSYTKAGALISFDSDYNDIGRQCGEIALKIFAGGRPIDIPVAFPQKIGFSLNLLTAQRLDIRIPESNINDASSTYGK